LPDNESPGDSATWSVLSQVEVGCAFTELKYVALPTSEEIMPLERLEGDPVIRLEGVAFGMRDVDDERTVQCLLTHEALMDVFDAIRQSQWLRAFETYRDEIETAASNVYDTGVSGEPVLVTTADLMPGEVE
jgi:hypothetical protein